MPQIIIEGPKLKTLEQKRELVTKITDITQEIYGIDRTHISVLFREYSAEDFAVAGTLITDLRKGPPK
ncbi:MAG: 2-hydroxymuconate tautomerase family protein [archaeon]|nr:2-hydroxymuconate tautomerase family protein [archaeon]